VVGLFVVGLFVVGLFVVGLLVVGRPCPLTGPDRPMVVRAITYL
jgi:hypothetical protein